LLKRKLAVDAKDAVLLLEGNKFAQGIQSSLQQILLLAETVIRLHKAQTHLLAETVTSLVHVKTQQQAETVISLVHVTMHQLEETVISLPLTAAMHIIQEMHLAATV
jgi:hypothetical protein